MWVLTTYYYVNLCVCVYVVHLRLLQNGKNIWLVVYYNNDNSDLNYIQMIKKKKQKITKNNI